MTELFTLIDLMLLLSSFSMNDICFSSMTVNLRGELTRLLKPGDIASIGGVFLPTPYTGFRAIRAGLTADTYLESMSVTIAKPSVNHSFFDCVV